MPDNEVAGTSGTIGDLAKAEALRKQLEKVRRAELIISGVLRIGVLLSLSIVIIGVVVAFASKPGVYLHTNATNKSLLSRSSAYPHSISTVFSGLAHLQGEAIIVFGLIILLATPMLRVLVSAFIFAFQRDRYFVPITVFVFLILVTSFLLGKAGG
ncbi:MAG: DUF1634 domain-containing protein [Acidimicrobiaceae bacterium]|nr:DUF1634 domain-containing protein [Acidimicrobiaceae bacterium]